MLKILKAQDWSGNFAYAPPLRDLLVNTDHVVSAQVCESRGAGPWYSLKLIDGKVHTVQGHPSDLLRPHTPLFGKHTCRNCGKRTSDETATCEHCGVEDK